MNVCTQFPLRIPKMQDQKSLTRCWLSFSGWGRGCVSLVFDYKGGQYIRKGQQYTNLNILRLAIGYLNATINRKTWKPEQAIGTDGSSQSQQNPWVDGYGSGVGPPIWSWSGLWVDSELNWTVSPVWTQTAGGFPGPIANDTPASCLLQCTSQLFFPGDWSLPLSKALDRALGSIHGCI